MAKFIVSGTSAETGSEPFVYDPMTRTFRLLKNIAPGNASGIEPMPGIFAQIGSGYVFSANDGVSGAELWFTDGTEQGTRLVKDLAPGLRSSAPQSLTVVGDLIYFSATSLQDGRELWRSDGTTDGTFMVADLVPGSGDGTPVDIQPYKTGVVFGSEGAGGIWYADGATVTQLTPAGEGFVYGALAVIGEQLLFTRPLRSFGELWISDGTVAGTRLLLDEKTSDSGDFGILRIFDVKQVGATALFTTEMEAGNYAIWRTDGTRQGTQLILDLGSNYVSNFSNLPALADGTLYEPIGYPGSTYAFRDTGAPVQVLPSGAYTFAAAASPWGKTYLVRSQPSTSQDLLYETDGTSAGTRLIHMGRFTFLGFDEDGIILNGAIPGSTDVGLYEVSAQGAVSGQTPASVYVSGAPLAPFDLHYRGTQGPDTLVGSFSPDELSGASGDDILRGAGGNDVLDGGDGLDLINAGTGDDLIVGSLGADRMYGEGGADTFRFSAVSVSSSAPSDVGVIDGGAGYDTLDLRNITPVLLGTISPSAGVFSLGVYVGSQRYAIEGVERILFGSSGDYVHTKPGLTGSLELRAGGGSDDIGVETLGEGAHLEVFGEEGDDVFFVSGSFTSSAVGGVLDGGAGSDQLKLNIGFTVDLRAGTATAYSASFAIAGFERVTVPAWQGYGSTVRGSDGADQVDVNTLFDDGSIGIVVEARGGDDSMSGSLGADTLDGGSGNDVIDGRAGPDRMTGGAGDDLFLVDEAGDVLFEEAGGGLDTVRTAVSNYVLPDHVERLVYIGAGGGELTGRSADDDLTGGAGSDLFRIWQGGTDRADGGDGNDSFLVGRFLNDTDRIIGGAGADVLALQGNYTGLTLAAGTVQGVETITLLPGSDTRFGDSGGNSYSYVLTTNDATVAAGELLKVNAATLNAGENLTFNGSAERDGAFFIYGGKGSDVLTGGDQADVFFLAEDRLTAGDRFDGGAGADILVIRGSYAAVLAADTFTNIETITLMSAADSRFYQGGGTSFTYNIVASDGTVAAGATLTVNGGALGATESMRYDGRAETNGAYRLFGGNADDTLRGGAFNDLIFGGMGADVLSGGGGSDVFRYQGVGESIASARDAITDFASGDRIDLSRIDANGATAGDQAFAFIGEGAFTGTAGQLRAVASGNSWLVEADADGDGVADLSLLVTVTDGHALGAADFVL